MWIEDKQKNKNKKPIKSNVYHLATANRQSVV